MNITLLNPPFIFGKKSIVTYSQCLGLLSIAATLRQRGHAVTVIDAMFEGRDVRTPVQDDIVRIGLTTEAIIARIPAKTDMIGLSVPFSHLAFIAHDLIRSFKRTFPGASVVMGGVYPSTQPHIAARSEADFIVLGEGELVMIDLAVHLAAPADHPLPAGVISRKDAGGAPPAAHSYVGDIDCLPTPARDMVPFQDYAARSPRYQVGGWMTASILTSRGCPYDCEFCSVHPVCGYQWRPRSAERVLMEIDELVDRYQINNLEIEDDNFTLKRERAIEILEGVIERNGKRSRKLSWGAFNGLRIDTLDEKIMSTIARSNCLNMALALEHGDADVLRSMNKRLDLAKAVDVVKLLHKFNIASTVFVIYGYPGETRERFDNALSFYVKLKQLAPRIGFAFYEAQPYPGTKLFERCVREGYLPADAFDHVHTIPRFSTEGSHLITTPDFDGVELERRRAVLMRTLLPGIYWMEKIRARLPESMIPSLSIAFHKAKRYIGK